jgi:DNA-binding Lrp family transcriptional regulator
MKVIQRERGPCWTLLKRLESSGAIQRYVAILDHKAIGLANIVFVEVTLNKHDDKVLEDSAPRLHACRKSLRPFSSPVNTAIWSRLP